MCCPVTTLHSFFPPFLPLTSSTSSQITSELLFPIPDDMKKPTFCHCLFGYSLQAGEWQAANLTFLAGPDGELTPPPPSRSLKATQAAVGVSTKHRFDSMRSENNAIALQHQVIELQQRLQVTFLLFFLFLLYKYLPACHKDWCIYRIRVVLREGLRGLQD